MGGGCTMKILSATKEDMSLYGKAPTSCDVYAIHVEVDDVNNRVNEMISLISDKSWIGQLGVVEKKAYMARAEPTIKKIVKEVLAEIDNEFTKEIGEYMVTDSAQAALEQQYGHKKVPYAELWKEQKSGNPGFDFHTESKAQLIAFGEAKYRSGEYAHSAAMKQIANFIILKKDDMELSDLQNFVGKDSIDNALAGKKAYVAAFSVNTDPLETMKKALASSKIDALLSCEELYLIGVTIRA